MVGRSGDARLRHAQRPPGLSLPTFRSLAETCRIFLYARIAGKGVDKDEVIFKAVVPIH